LASADKEGISVSVGVAFVKESYPVAQAHEIAEMCLDSAKAAGYARKESSQIMPYIDWHVHFDSVYQDLKDIRRSSYILSYADNDKELNEILSKRPYTAEDLQAMLSEIKSTAKKLDEPDAKFANNKIKTYRSALKNGYRDVEFIRNILLKDDKELLGFLPYRKPQNGLRLDSSLDKIEIIDFYRDSSQKKEEAEHEQH
jgi:hypothetical protein